jgi:hypothetical protein
MKRSPFVFNRESRVDCRRRFERAPSGRCVLLVEKEHPVSVGHRRVTEDFNGMLQFVSDDARQPAIRIQSLAIDDDPQVAVGTA